jgi:hypothetical protein
MLEQTKLRVLASATIAAAGGDGSAADQISLVPEGDEQPKFNESSRLEALAVQAARPRP